jgi:hypothetical protein
VDLEIAIPISESDHGLFVIRPSEFPLSRRWMTLDGLLFHLPLRSAIALPGDHCQPDAGGTEQAKNGGNFGDPLACDCKHHDREISTRRFCFRTPPMVRALTLAP